MSDDILSRATLALRDGQCDKDGKDGDDERNGRPTLTRVLRTVQRSRGRRRVMWIVGLQLAFGGVAVGAWAVRSGGVRGAETPLCLRRRSGARRPHRARP